MPRRQKRFKSEHAILAAIDEMESKRRSRLEEAEQIEDSMRTLRVEEFPSHDEFTAQLDYRRKMAGLFRRSSERAARKKAELGKLLSAYRTMLLPFPDNDDNSVVL